MTRVLTKGFNVTPEREIIILRNTQPSLNSKSASTGDSYLFSARLYTSSNNTGKTHLDGKKLEEKMPTNLDGARAT